MESLVDNDINFIERFLNAFKTLGGNEFGFIDYDNFKQILQHKNVAETKDIIELINVERNVKDGKLNFVSLCFSILSTKVIFNRSFSNGKVAVPRPQIDTNTFTRNRVPVTATDDDKLSANSTSENCFERCFRGMLYKMHKELLCNRYVLELLEDCDVEIFAKALSSRGEIIPNVPIEILVFQQCKGCVSYSTIINEGGYCAASLTKKGRYIVQPILWKWKEFGRSNSFDSLNLGSLINIEDGSNVTVTPACEHALKVIFDCIDLDENGFLSQQEFDVFILHASGETSAEEWKTIEDNFDVKDHQLSFDGFNELYKMVLQTDPTDVMNMLQRMGMNESLEMENTQPMRLFVKSKVARFLLGPLPVSSYEENGDFIMRKFATELGSRSNVQNDKNIILFTHRLPHRITLVLQNVSRNKITVRLDCSKSTNCQSHIGFLDIQVEVSPKSSIVGHHLFPVDFTQSWDMKCSESILPD